MNKNLVKDKKVNIFLIISLKPSRAAQKIVAGRNLTTPEIKENKNLETIQKCILILPFS